jgi:hypothetical protein
VHGFRPDYQDEVNFVILDYDIKEQRAFASEMAAARHPAFTVIPPNGSPDDATDRRFGPISNEHMQILLDELVATYGN